MPYRAKLFKGWTNSWYFGTDDEDEDTGDTTVDEGTEDTGDTGDNTNTDDNDTP